MPRSAVSTLPATVRSGGSTTGSEATEYHGPTAEFLDVHKTYRNFLPWFPWRTSIEAVRGVSLQVHPGEVLALLGPNRAGKTTLVKLLLSLCRPTAGTVRRLGRPTSERSTLGAVGYVHENHAFPRYLSAKELLEYYGALSLLPSNVIQERIPPLLEQAGLADRSREPIARFSKGMLQRLGIAQALLNEPKLLVLDEPTEGLDLDGRLFLRTAIRDVRNRKGSVLLISHTLTEVDQVCDRVAVLVRGSLVHTGRVADLRPLDRTLERLYAGGKA